MHEKLYKYTRSYINIQEAIYIYIYMQEAIYNLRTAHTCNDRACLRQELRQSFRVVAHIPVLLASLHQHICELLRNLDDVFSRVVHRRSMMCVLDSKLHFLARQYSIIDNFKQVQEELVGVDHCFGRWCTVFGLVVGQLRKLHIEVPATDMKEPSLQNKLQLCCSDGLVLLPANLWS